MKKTFPIVMLPTTKESILGIRTDFEGDNKLYTGGTFKLNSKYKPQHLYIISDEEIKEGDWFVDLSTKTIHNSFPHYTNNPYSLKKIVATTDTFIMYNYESFSVNAKSQYPNLPESFIQEYIKAYNEGKPITEVDLEVVFKDEGFGSSVIPYRSWYEIKTRPDNTVIVHQSKMYTRYEVEQLLRKFDDAISYETDGGGYNYYNVKIPNIDEFIKDNL